MNYNPSEYSQTVPSRTTVVPSDNQLEYSAGQTIRFDIEKFIGFIDPRSTALKMTIEVDCAVPCSLPRHSGAQALIQNLRLYDGQQLVQFESLTDYGRRVELMSMYSENPSVLAKRQLLEGVPQRRDAYNALSSAQFEATTFGGAYEENEEPNVDNTANRNPNQIEVMLPLWSGILGTGPDTAGGGSAYPNLLTGLHLELDLQQPQECLTVHANSGTYTRKQANNVHDTWCPFEIRDLSGGDASGVQLDEFSIKAASTQNNAPSTTSLVLPTDGIPLIQKTVRDVAENVDCTSQHVQSGTSGCSNWSIGSGLQATGPEDFPSVAFGATQLRFLGNVTELVPTDLDTLDPYIKVKVSDGYTPVDGSSVLVPADVNGNGAVMLCDGWQQGNQNNGELGCAGVPTVNGQYPSPTYRVKNVELCVKACSPPKQYVESLVKQAMSKEGMQLDFLSYETNRNNVNASEQMSQIVIPTFAERATAVMSLPYPPTDYANPVGNEPLTPVFDSAKSYNWYVANQSQPTQKVDVKRSSYRRYDQLFLWETEKALTAMRLPIRNLDSYSTDDGGSNYNPNSTLTSKGLAYSRALAKYGGVYNLQSDGSLQLRTEYFDPQINKLFITFLAHLRRLRVSSEGITVDA
tara:strand:+ start:3135 stop:5036 length:1902 start_codon:yes stop_codon:yes gene_type:complete